MKLYSQIELKQAHDHCTQNKSALMKSKICGCFYCISTFTPDGIEHWHGEENMRGNNNPKAASATALCPNCGIDSVLGDASGFPITESFLIAMYEQYFGDECSLDPSPFSGTNSFGESFQEMFEAALKRHSK
jgi:hypothetical protein